MDWHRAQQSCVKPTKTPFNNKEHKPRTVEGALVK